MNHTPLRPATVASKRLGDGPETHYMLGPQRATRQEAETDLERFEGLTADERAACRVARVAASSETDCLLDIIERLAGEKLPFDKHCSCGWPMRWNGGTWECQNPNCAVGEIGRHDEPPAPTLEPDPFVHCAGDHLDVGAQAGASAAETLAEDYARRFRAVADSWDVEALLWDGPTQSIALRGRATGLREAATMLLDKDSR